MQHTPRHHANIRNLLEKASINLDFHAEIVHTPAELLIYLQFGQKHFK